MSLRPQNPNTFGVSLGRLLTDTALLAALLLLAIGGCGGGGDEPASAGADATAQPPDTGESDSPDTQQAGTKATSDTPRHQAPKRTLKPVQLGSFPVNPNSPGNASATPTPSGGADATSAADQTEQIIAALRPLQVLLGEWRSLTAKTFDGFKAIDQPKWVWDLTTDPAQPALVMTSDESPYFRHLRLTYFPGEKVYFLSMRDPQGNVRTFRGTFTQPPRDVPGDDRKPQRTFKLQLTEVGEGPRGERWQLVFNQQENNRCLIEIGRARGSGTFRRMDTVALQRQGTSFALSDTDYGEKTCVISQGLGTIAVSYKGRTYWVCCTGCKAAFEEDPERWIARFERLKKKDQP